MDTHLEMAASNAVDAAQQAEAVANACSFSYRVNEIDAIVTSLGSVFEALFGEYSSYSMPVVVLPTLHKVECVFDADSDLEAAVKPALRLLERGVDVWVLVPTHRLGQAHALFRGTASKLQGWWQHDDRTAFGTPEIP